MLSATGTADATTFLRGDNAWASAGGNNTPAFQAYLSAEQSISNDITTKIALDGVDFDTASGYDETTNYRYTVPAGEGGKYCVYYLTGVRSSANSTYQYGWAEIRLNGSAVSYDEFNFRLNNGRVATFSGQIIYDLAAADYIELWTYMLDSASASGFIRGGGGAAMRITVFGAYKMMGL